MELLTQAEPVLNKIAALHEKQRALMVQLDTSLFIRSIWPDVFRNGSRCTVRIGTHTCHEWDQFIAGRLEIDTAYLVRLDDGATRRISAEEFRKIHFSKERTQ